MENPEQIRDRFSKRLTPDDVTKCQILFLMTAVEGIFTFEEGRQFCFDVVSRNGAWTFMSRFQTNEEMGPHLVIRWPQFATENGLKADDEVTFIRLRPEEKKNTSWDIFKIEVRRRIRLFGQDIWGELMV